MKISTTIAGRPYEVKTPEILLDYDRFTPDDLQELCRLAADGGIEALWQLGRSLQHKSKMIRKKALELLDVMRERGVDLSMIYPQLLNAMAEVRVEGCDVRDLLVRMGPAMTGIMLQSLEQGEATKTGMMAQNVIGALARIGDAEAMEFFMRWGESEDASRRGHAADFFGEIFQCRPELTTAEMVKTVKRLMDDPNEDVARIAKVARFQHSRNQNAKTPIVEPSMLESEDLAVVLKAVEHLAEREIPVPGTAPGLHRLMQRRDLGEDGERIRGLALTALCTTDCANSLNYLRELVELEQRIGREGLEVINMNMEESLPLIDEWIDAPETGLRHAAAVAVGDALHCLYARNYIPKLWEMLRGEDEALRLAAIQVLLNNAKQFLMLHEIWHDEHLALNKATVEETRQMLIDTTSELKKVDKKSKTIRAISQQLQRKIKKIESREKEIGIEDQDGEGNEHVDEHDVLR